MVRNCTWSMFPSPLTFLQHISRFQSAFMCCLIYSSQHPCEVGTADISLLISRWGNWGKERLSDLPKITQLISGRARTRNQVFWLLGHYSSHLNYWPQLWIMFCVSKLKGYRSPFQWRLTVKLIENYKNSRSDDFTWHNKTGAKPLLPN